MTHSDKIIEMISDMKEAEAKELLARIFLKLDRINNYDYSKEKALEEIREIYRTEVVGRMVFGKGK